ncbi:MAG: DUF2147 domain-containing protein [Bacteroidetes bacterium]|nr:DUF2147 domain-containing protein [Bacteroidota bacterium]
MKQPLILTLLFFSLSAFISSDGGEDDVTGVWLNGHETAHIEIFKTGKYFYGKIIWLKNPTNDQGEPKKDLNNPDANMRLKPLINLLILKGFEYEGNHKWSEGTIYDPKEGKTYSCKMWFEDENTDNLQMRGFVGVSLMGRTETWKRVK